jgi:hypothetical protein
MKRILLLPRTTSGIVDVRKQEYFILNGISYLEEIQTALKKQGKLFADYKFCQFEERETIPYFINIKDKLTNGFAEFECKRVKFKNAPVEEEEKKQMIEERHLAPLQQKMRDIVYQVNYLMAMERLGDEIKEDEFIQIGIQKDKVKEEISNFEYQKYFDEIA